MAGRGTSTSVTTPGRLGKRASSINACTRRTWRRARAGSLPPPTPPVLALTPWPPGRRSRRRGLREAVGSCGRSPRWDRPSRGETEKSASLSRCPVKTQRAAGRALATPCPGTTGLPVVPVTAAERPEANAEGHFPALPRLVIADTQDPARLLPFPAFPGSGGAASPGGRVQAGPCRAEGTRRPASHGTFAAAPTTRRARLPGGREHAASAGSLF